MSMKYYQLPGSFRNMLEKTRFSTDFIRPSAGAGWQARLESMRQAAQPQAVKIISGTFLNMQGEYILETSLRELTSSPAEEPGELLQPGEEPWTATSDQPVSGYFQLEPLEENKYITAVSMPGNAEFSKMVAGVFGDRLLIRIPKLPGEPETAGARVIHIGFSDDPPGGIIILPPP